MSAVFGVTFIWLIVLVVGIILIVALYKKIYNNYANKALNGEPNVKLLDINQLFVIIVVIVFLVLAFSIKGKVDNLQLNISNLVNQLNNQSIYISSLENEVEDLNEMLEEYIQGEQLIQNMTYELSDYNSGIATYDISFDLKELSSDSVVKLVVIDEQDNSISYTLTSDTLSFNTSVDLSDELEYDLKVLIENEVNIQEDLVTIDVYQEIFNRLYAYIEPYYNENEEDWVYINCVITNDTLGNENLEIESVTIILRSGETYLDTYVLNTATDILGDVEIFSIDYHDTADVIHLINAEITVTDTSGNEYVFNIEL